MGGVGVQSIIRSHIGVSCVRFNNNFLSWGNYISNYVNDNKCANFFVAS